MSKTSRASGRIGLATGGDNQLGSCKGLSSLVLTWKRSSILRTDTTSVPVRMSTPFSNIFISRHLIMVWERSVVGKTRPWSSTLSLTVFLKEIHNVVVVKLRKDAVQRPLPGIPASKSSSVPLLVTLQRPPPVPDSFLPKRLFFEKQGLLAVKAGRNGAIMPWPAPIIMVSTVFMPLLYHIFIKKVV